jgi:lipoteichoic acid synthase
MTVSGHCVYTLNENVQSRKHYDKVADAPYSETVKYYLASQMELEYAMAALMQQLEEAGIADDTVIVISTDHYPYGLAPSDTWGGGNNLSEIYGGDDYGDEKIRDRNTLIIWSGCLEDMDIVVDEPVYALDILPTLSNLFGLEYDSRLVIGRDVFSDQEPLVIWSATGGWMTDKGSYDARTGVFTPREGVEVSEDYVANITATVRNKMKYSRDVQQYNYFNVISDLMGYSKED